MDDAWPFIVATITMVAIFIVLPAMIFHHVTLWRKQRTLQPDDERMLEDLWRSAKAMERRIETLEALIDAQTEDREAAPRRRPRPSEFDS